MGGHYDRVQGCKVLMDDDISLEAVKLLVFAKRYSVRLGYVGSYLRYGKKILCLMLHRPLEDKSLILEVAERVVKMHDFGPEPTLKLAVQLHIDFLHTYVPLSRYEKLYGNRNGIIPLQMEQIRSFYGNDAFQEMLVMAGVSKSA